MAYYNILIFGKSRPKEGQKYRNLNDNSFKNIDRILKRDDWYYHMYRRLDRLGKKTEYVKSVELYDR